MKPGKPVVFIVCTGLGHINRGYESFTRECFDSLKDSNCFNLYLLKGGGPSKSQEIKINCFKRNSAIASFCARVFGKEAYWIEQLTFFLGMIPMLLRYKPSVIYYSDFILGTWLWHFREKYKFKYKLLFSNGAPNEPPFTRMDHVQQLLPVYLEQAIAKGCSPAMQTLLPYGFDIDIKKRIDAISQKQIVREKLGFTYDQKLIVSVGAINKHHKRMDFIVREIGLLPENYHLIILGQFEDDSTEIMDLATQLLPGRHLILNVSYEKMKEYYTAADYFALASLSEGFGRVIIEAMSYGLPCIIHDYVNARQVLKEYGYYVDMSKPGAIASLLSENRIYHSSEASIAFAYENYSWDKLKSKYSLMISQLNN